MEFELSQATLTETVVWGSAGDQLAKMVSGSFSIAEAIEGGSGNGQISPHAYAFGP